MNLSKIFLLCFSLLLTQSAFARNEEGGATSGGGNGIAAEIQRATDEFISLVRENPAKFPGVDPAVLQNMNPEILVTGKPISFCGKPGELDALSDREKNQSLFNFNAWVAKDWMAKVHLAGHERLVLAKYEASNRYPFSNKLYEIFLEKTERRIGKAKSICELSGRACRQLKDDDKMITDIVAMALDPAIGLSAERGIEHLNMNKLVIESEKLLLIGLKKIEIQRRWINLGNVEAEVAEYAEQVELAYESHFRPLFLEAERLIRESATAPELQCVQDEASSTQP